MRESRGVKVVSRNRPLTGVRGSEADVRRAVAVSANAIGRVRRPGVRNR
jgi:hypothetical protein